MKRSLLQAFLLLGILFIVLISFGLVTSSHALIGANQERTSGRGVKAVESMAPFPQSSNHSVSFNGTSAYLDAPHSTSLNITGPITLEAWVKLPATTGDYRTILAKVNYTGSEGGYDLDISDQGKVRIDIYNTASQYNYVIGGTALSANVWHHVAGVYDGSQLRVYVDGTLDGTSYPTLTLTSSSQSLLIGKGSHPVYPQRFSGLMDEVRVSAGVIYSSNFTPAAHLTAGAQTRGLWKFDGQTANDFSTN